MKEISTVLKNGRYLRSLAVSFVFLAFALLINYYASTYATLEVSNPVSDIILSNIPVFDVDEAFVYGSIAFILCIVLVCLGYPKRIPFTLKSISLFVVIRAVFISLTHIAPFPTHIALDPVKIVSDFTFGGDLFFSGHTGMPFLVALIFWDNRHLRISFLSLSVILGAVTLMGHLHYSIDVFSAFFITYSIFKIAERAFPADRALAYEANSPVEKYKRVVGENG